MIKFYGNGYRLDHTALDLDYTALEVGDQVAYLSPWNHAEPKNAKPANVTKVTKKQVTVAWSDTESCTFMRESGNPVGASSSWRRAHLITLEQMERAKKQDEAIHSFQSTMRDIENLVKNYSHHRNDSIRAADRNKLESLIASLKVHSFESP